MKVSHRIGCRGFPCTDVDRKGYMLPRVDVDPKNISMLMISEAAPSDPSDYYYAKGNPLFQQTTVEAFRDAGADVSSVRDILGIGVYLTTAVKCRKKGYRIKAATVQECSSILEQEIGLFPNVNVFMLMGDVAIKALNYIAGREGAGRVIPAGSTYKIRKGKYSFRGKRVFPSYLQAGPAFFVEKSKRRMIADDLRKALRLLD